MRIGIVEKSVLYDTVRIGMAAAGFGMILRGAACGIVQKGGFHDGEFFAQRVEIQLEVPSNPGNRLRVEWFDTCLLAPGRKPRHTSSTSAVDTL
jgi:hypothetical protein